MGGGIVTSFCSEYPELVDRLVILSPAGGPLTMPFGFGLIKSIPLSAAAWILSKLNNEPVIIQKDFYKPEKHQEIIDWILKQRAVQEADRIFGFANSLQNFPLMGLSVEAVGKQTRKTLILWGDNDEVTSYKESYPWWKKMFPNAMYRVIAETRHGFFLEKPTAVNNIILNFLQDKLDSNVQEETIY